MLVLDGVLRPRLHAAERARALGPSLRGVSWFLSNLARSTRVADSSAATFMTARDLSRTGRCYGANQLVVTEREEAPDGPVDTERRG